ncbi:divIVA domain [Firmicutes bacterium CAG:822]|nr:divIVA domain [Firmicutes bacterium CAG:822]
MEKFTRVMRGYDPDEVNNFLDQVIKRVEKMIADIDAKNKLIVDKNDEIRRLKSKIDETSALKEKLEQYERMESTLNRAILMAQKTSDQLKVAAHRESEIILDDAKKNASRIVNEALIKAEKIENDADMMKRNINVLKRRLKNIVESQLEIIDDMDKLDI